MVFYQVQWNAAEIEAMRSGRLHVCGIGMALDTALNLLQWDRVGTVQLAISVAVIAAEVVVTGIGRRML